MKHTRILASALAIAIMTTTLFPASASSVLSLQTDPVQSPGSPIGYLDPDIDEDGDGIINSVEDTYGTDFFHADSDGDGLDDYQELMIYGTDPQNMDSDSDNIDDGVEVQSGFDPLDASSAPDEQYTYLRTKDSAGVPYSEVSLLITGTGRASRSWLWETSNHLFQHGTGVFSPLYLLTAEEGIEKIQVTIAIDSDINNPAAVLYFTKSDNTIRSFESISNDEQSVSGVKAFSPGEKIYCFAGSPSLIGKSTDGCSVAVALQQSEKLDAAAEWENEFSALTDLVSTTPVQMLTARRGEIEISSYQLSAANINDATANVWQEGGPASPNSITSTDTENSEVSLLDAAAQKVQDNTFLKPVLISVSDYDSNHHMQFVAALESYADQNYYIEVIDLTNTLTDDQISDITEAGAQVSLNARLSIGTLVGDLNQITGNNKSPYAVISGDSFFDPVINGVSFRNGDVIAYGSAGQGVCAGIAMASILNYYGQLPARMKMDASFRSKLELLKERETDASLISRYNELLKLENGSTIYDITKKIPSMSGFVGGATQNFNHTANISDEVGKMMAAWWCNLSYAQRAIYTGTGSPVWPQYKNEGKGGPAGFISNETVSALKAMIDKKQPVYIAAGSTESLNNNTYYHAVVATSYEQNGNTIILTLSDSNFPGSSGCTIELQKGTSGWSFIWEDLDLRNNPLETYKFVVIDTSALLRNLIENSSRKRVVLKYNSPTSYTITGNIINSTNDLVVIRNGFASAATTQPNFSVSANAPFYCTVAAQYDSKNLPSVLNSTRYFGEMPAFTDISSNQWYYPYVRVAVLSGIMSGRNSTTFDPYSAINGQEFITSLLRALSVPVGPSASWPSDYLAVAETNGWLDGLPSNFSATAPLKRADAAVILWNAFTSDLATGNRVEYDPDAPDLEFSDLSLLTGQYSYAYDAIQQTCNIGLFSTGTVPFNPAGTLARTDVCVTLLKGVGYTF